MKAMKKKSVFFSQCNSSYCIVFILFPRLSLSIAMLFNTFFRLCLFLLHIFKIILHCNFIFHTVLWFCFTLIFCVPPYNPVHPFVPQLGVSQSMFFFFIPSILLEYIHCKWTMNSDFQWFLWWSIAVTEVIFGLTETLSFVIRW